MKNKCLHVTMHYFPIFGGQEVYIDSLSRILEKYSFSNEYMQPFRGGSEGRDDIIFTSPGRYFHRFIDGFDWFWFNLNLVLKRRRLATTNVVLSNYFFHYPVIPHNTKTIVISHGIDWSEKSNSLFNRYKRHVAKAKLRSGDILVANCTEILRYRGIKVKALESAFKEVAPNTFFIPNCVDTNKFVDLNILREKQILVPRNIRRSRGVALSIEAFRSSKAFSDGYKLVIAGGPLKGSYFKECVLLVEKYNLHKSVVFLGNITQDELLKEYNKSTISVIPTLEMEGTSLSALESMSCGCPVVATYVGGLKDIPCIHAEADSIDLAAKIDKLIKNVRGESERQKAAIESNYTLGHWELAWKKVIDRLD